MTAAGGQGGTALTPSGATITVMIAIFEDCYGNWAPRSDPSDPAITVMIAIFEICDGNRQTYPDLSGSTIAVMIAIFDDCYGNWKP